jgi:hypothetical protein
MKDFQKYKARAPIAGARSGSKIDDPRDKGSLGEWHNLPGLLRLDGRSITLAFEGRTRLCLAALQYI